MGSEGASPVDSHAAVWRVGGGVSTRLGRRRRRADEVAASGGVYRPKNHLRRPSVQALRKRIMEFSLLRTFAPGSESTMVWNFRSLELSLPGAERKFLELSLPGTFAPGSESSKNFRSKELSLPGTFAPGNESSKNFDAIFETVKCSVKL